MFGCSADASPLGASAPLLWRGLSLALALAAFAIWGAPAHASCGDYVVIGKPAGRQAADEARPSRPEAPKPCHGPHCQAAPRPIAAPPAAPTTLHRAPESCVMSGDATFDLDGALLALRVDAPFSRPLSGCYPPQWRPPEAVASRQL